jgi:hypothetical protein
MPTGKAFPVNPAGTIRSGNPVRFAVLVAEPAPPAAAAFRIGNGCQMHSRGEIGGGNHSTGYQPASTVGNGSQHFSG